MRQGIIVSRGGIGRGKRAKWKLAAVLAALVAATAAPWQAAGAQSAFQIVWVVIGEASSPTDNGSAHAGRQLFMGSDLVSKSLANIKIEQVDVQPAMNEITVGERLCLTSMNIRALGPERAPVAGAPLSVSVRQDHKHRLGLRRSMRDICVRPNVPGEYPLRFTSMLPAQDGTVRGAQVFVRVSDPNATSTTADDIR